MQKLLFKICLFFSVPILFVGAVSYYADPAEIFHDRSKKVVEILQQQQNVGINVVAANWSNIHIAMVQNFEKKQMPPHTVLWGSSRSAEINEDFVHHQSFFNHVLPGANIVDYVAMLGLYLEENKLPKTIIINIDPILFYPVCANGKFFVKDTNPSAKLQVRAGLEKYLEKGLIALDTTKKLLKQFPISAPKNSFYTNISMLFQPDYFQTSLRSITKEPVIALYEKEKAGYFVIRKDGGYSLLHTDWINDAQVAARAKDFVNATNGRYLCDECVKNQYFSLFKKLIIYLSQQEKREVILLFSPIQPIAYQRFLQNEQNILETSCKQFADSLNIKTIGTYNPQLAGVAKIEKAFIDEIHLSKKGMDIFLEQIEP